jgi:hypothetical protein
MSTETAYHPSRARCSAVPDQALDSIQGLSPEHRERLAEEGIATVQNLALGNPLILHLRTAYHMGLLIDWIDQAYLRCFVTAEVAGQLRPMGIRGAVEMAQVDGAAQRTEMLANVAGAIGTDAAGAENLVQQLKGDPEVQVLEFMWSMFGGT